MRRPPWRVSGRAPSPTSVASVCSLTMADLKERVAAKIAEMRPYLERTGGRIEVVDAADGNARIRVGLTRPRARRPVASLPLKSGIQRAPLGDIRALRGGGAVD